MELKIEENLTKSEKFEEIERGISGLWDDEIGQNGNLSNFLSLLHFSFGWFWTGFYFVKNGRLELGPFQGPVACTTIAYGKGVCGWAWKENQSIFVPDVNLFPGHIACSSSSVSEIVIPIRNSKNEVVGVLDIDSDNYDTLEASDVEKLENIVKFLKDKI